MRPPFATFATFAAAALSLGLVRGASAQEQAPLAPLPPVQPPPVVLAPAPQPAPPPPVIVPAVPAVRGAVVHVTADRAVMLQLLSSNDTRWRDVCLSPCDLEVPLDAVYRVIAPGIMPSRELELEASPSDRVTLDVNVRSLAQHRTAERLTIAGYVLGAAGLGLEIAALAIDSSSGAEPVLLWSGAGAAVAAISLTITSYVLGQPTGVSQSRAALQVSASASGPPLPRTTGIPLLTMPF
jgi:hypothetical protein